MIDMLAKTFLVFALTTGTPQPMPNYGLPTTQESVDTLMEFVLDDVYKLHLDFNADLQLNLADVVSAKRRYEEIQSFNEVTFEYETVEEMFETNCIAPIYWEIDSIDNKIVRKYKVTTNKTAIVDIYFELENGSGNMEVTINPTSETATINKIEIRS